MTNPFADRLRARESLVGAWATIGHPVVAEVLAAEPVDFVVLDGEHSESTIGDLADCVRAVEATNQRVPSAETATVVRASAPDRAEIKRLLELGVDGLVVPQIESVGDARTAVDATQYPPAGVRGVAGGRASEYGTDVDREVEGANDRVATVLQVETPGAVDDLDAIAALDGVDSLFVGPADLSARLGDFGNFDAPAFRDARERVVDAATNADGAVSVGTLATSTENATTRRDDWNMDYVVAGVDLDYLRDGLGDYLDALDGGGRE